MEFEVLKFEVKCEMWTCEVWSVECSVRSAQCGV